MVNEDNPEDPCGSLLGDIIFDCGGVTLPRIVEAGILDSPIASRPGGVAAANGTLNSGEVIRFGLSSEPGGIYVITVDLLV